MIKGGWIRLHRSLLDWEWWDDDKALKLFIYLLLRANIEDTEYKGFSVPRGSLVTSYTILAQECGQSIKQIRGSLEKLISTGEVAKRSTSKFSILTLNNYDKYQPMGSQKAHNGAVKGHAKGQQNKNTTYVVKNERNKEGADAPNALLGEIPEGVTFPEGITNMADYLKYLEE